MWSDLINLRPLSEEFRCSGLMGAKKWPVLPWVKFKWQNILPGQSWTAPLTTSAHSQCHQPSVTPIWRQMYCYCGAYTLLAEPLRNSTSRNKSTEVYGTVWIGNWNLGNLFARLCISLNVAATKLLLSFSDSLKQLENVNRRPPHSLDLYRHLMDTKCFPEPVQSWASISSILDGSSGNDWSLLQ